MKLSMRELQDLLIEQYQLDPDHVIIRIDGAEILSTYEYLTMEESE